MRRFSSATHYMKSDCKLELCRRACAAENLLEASDPGAVEPLCILKASTPASIDCSNGDIKPQPSPPTKPQLTECPRCGKPPMNYDVKDGCRCGTESTKESKMNFTTLYIRLR